MGEHICKQSDRQGINLQKRQTAHAPRYQKNKQPNQKMGRTSKQTFLQRRHTNDMWNLKKMVQMNLFTKQK